jgi:cell division protein FtsZ
MVEAQEGEEEEELVLGSGDMLAIDEPPAEEATDDEPSTGNRSWLTGQEGDPPPPRAGGTLFERMSNLARGAAKAQVDEDNGPARGGNRDPLDIPRFLNRQNNQ